MGRIPSWARGVLAAAAVAVAASAASAQSYHQIIPGGDTVTGDISGSADVDRFPFRLVEGTKLTFTLKAGKKSLLKPTITMLGTDREPDAAANAALVTNSKGTSVALKKFLIGETGTRWIEVRGAAGTTGTWTLVGKVTLPKGFAGTGSSAGGGASTTIEFTSPGNATATFVVAAAKGSLALPEFESLKDPKGANVTIDYDVPTKKGFGIKGVPLPEPGKHALRVKSAAAGDFTVKVKWKVLKPVKKTITEGQVIADPIPFGIDPSSGDVSETLEVTLSVDFAVQGAKVVFRKGTSAITIQPSAITVGAESATFDLVLSSFQKGTYDVEIENPDTGKGVLPAAFSIVLSPAEITSVVPGFGYANQTAAVITVNGKYMNTGATIELSRGLETIPGTGVTGVATALQATFDLTGHTWGYYDITVTNPGVLPTTYGNAYEIRNPLPVVASITPENNRDSAVVDCYVTGAEFDDAPTMFLRMDGESDIPATNVVFVNDTELTCTFDTTGAAAGAWDVVVVNPDLGEGSLANAFGVTGPVGSPTKLLTASYDYDGPSSIVYNAARDEFCLAYVEENGTYFDLWVQRLDADGVPSGNRVQVSTAGATVPKRDACIGWDHENNQYLVAWAEISSGTGGSLWAVFAQRIDATDLSLLSASNIKLSDNALVSTSAMDSFNNYRPDVCWDATSNHWKIIWQQEWSVAADDFDIIDRNLTASDGLSTPTGTYITPYHESEPTIAYDAASGSVVIAHNYRGSVSAPLNVRVGLTTVASDTANQTDPDIVMDTDTGRMILTWTQAPSGGVHSVVGATFNGATRVGNLVQIGASTDSHFLCRKAYNSKSKETLLAWTRRNSLGETTVLARRAETGDAGLTLIADEYEPSSGATTEAMPVVAANSASGQLMAFWLKTVTQTSLNAYNGGTLTGQIRGKELWYQRYQ